MLITSSFVTTTALLVLVMAFPRNAWCSNIPTVIAWCDNDTIDNAGQEHVMVNLTFNLAQDFGATCNWSIPAGNTSDSIQVMLTSINNEDALSCDQNVFSVSELDPKSGEQTPLTVECVEESVHPNHSLYKALIGQPGFTMVVTLNTSSALSANFLFMHIFSFVLSEEVCPRNERKVIVTEPGNKGQTFYPRSPNQLGRFPNNLTCLWEFRSPDEGIVHLELKTPVFYSDSSRRCGRGDYLVVSESNGTTGSVDIPLCKNPGFRFKRESLRGSILVDMVSDSTGGAYQAFYFRYWSIPSCPFSTLQMRAKVGEKYRFKGSSFAAKGAGQKQQCRWQITARARSVVKLYQLEAEEFQQNCDENKDYLLVNDVQVSLCNSSAFPIWSESQTMNVSLQTVPEDGRTFVVHFTAVYKSPCQGYPQQRTVVGSRYRGDLVLLMPIPKGDVRNGLVCQWVFTAEDEGNAVEVSVVWAPTGSAREDNGVPFNKETCSFANFHVYDGNTANISAQIAPTCLKDNTTIVFTSTSRCMLFVYHRESEVEESGFVMEVNQAGDTVSDSSTGNCGKDVSWLVPRVALTGLLASVLVELVS